MEGVHDTVGRDVDVGLEEDVAEGHGVAERRQRVLDAVVRRESGSSPVREREGEGRVEVRVRGHGDHASPTRGAARARRAPDADAQMSRKVSIWAPRALRRSARSS